MTDTQPGPQNLSTLLQLEAEARKAESVAALQFLVVNETRRLINYRQAFYISEISTDRHRVEAASSLSVVDRNAPLTTWLESMADQLRSSGQHGTVKLDAAALPAGDAASFEAYSLPYVLFCPLTLPDGRSLGGLWLSREAPWDDSEILLVERLADTYAHAMNALLGGRHHRSMSQLSRRILIGAAAMVLLAAVIPVRMSTIAPVEIVPLEPLVVSAPMDGVIREISQSPNTTVAAGDLLFRFEDTNHRNRLQIAEQSYEVARARLRKATQGAFQDDAFRGQVALLQSELALKEAELVYARELLSQVDVTAPVSGLLVYTDESDWIGKPVAVGEKVMEIVDPARVKFRIQLSIDDAIVLESGAEVDVFLHADPLTSIQAVVTRSSYTASLTPAGVLAYQLDAQAVDDQPAGRIGLQGSARVYGQKVSVLFYVFRRPLSALRQFLGL